MNRLFDETVFHTLGAELGEADALEVLRVFLADTADKIAELPANGEPRALIKRQAHSIKSSAATFGFEDLSGLARELESSAETMTAAKLQDCLAALRQAFETTRQFARANLLQTRIGASS
jgi:hypothetical protein